MAAVAVGAGGEGAGSGYAAQSVDGAGPAQALGRDPAGAAAPVGTAFEPGGDLPRPGRRGVFAEDRRGLGRAPSTVSREVAGNGGRRSYRALPADQAAWFRACRPKQTKLGRWPGLRAMVEDKLELRWSPEQIAGGCGGGSRPADAGLARVHLPLTVRAGPRRPPERTDPPSAHQPGHPPAEGTRLPDGRGLRPHILNISDARPRPPIGRCPVTGKATWSSAAG